MAQVSPPATGGVGASSTQNAESTNGDIVVTAQRREESASKVPISMATYSQKQLDLQGIRKIDDLARLTPALTFTTTSGVNGNNGTNIAIRGIASEVGSSTTAIYIDDTPIQIRNIGYLGGNPYPRIFDLNRVEVLRGPQGTLFGSSAEGGAVRFITAQPSFDKTSVYARVEGSTIDHGSQNYEAGLAVGGPVTSNLAVRASGWFRRDGGYIDQVTPQTENIIAKDVNSQRTYAAKFALSWRPFDAFTITPSIFYQKVEARALNTFWAGYGDVNNNNFQTGVNHLEPSNDRFVLPALRIQYNMNNVTFISNTSYFDRRQFQQFSYTTYQSYLRTGNPFGNFANKDTANSDITLNTHQRNLVQEARLISTDNKLIDWTLGLYFSNTKQGFSNLTESGRIPGVLSRGLAQYLGRYSYFETTHANDQQLAGYANVDIKPTRTLKVSLSARYTHNKFDFDDTTGGPTVGNITSTVNSSAKENAFTPKATATWQVTPDHMAYATASKGFRPGGAQPLVSSEFCGSDLAALGLTRSPTSYKSDTLWNYEVGSKNKFLGGKVTIDADAYHLKWKNIQQSINLPTCNLNFVGNLGSATGNGAELSFTVTPITGFQLGASFAYTHIAYDKDISTGNGQLFVAKDQRLGGPLWSGSAFAQIDYPVTDSITAYFRADYSFATDKTPQQIDGNFGYDPDLPALPNTNFTSLRAGVRLSRVDLSVFVDNLTNSRDLLSRNHDGLGGSLFYEETYRPRTVGLTGQFRY